MKPARSPQRTACLSILRVTSSAVASTSAAVATVVTTSTSFMIAAGLKKCMPMTSAGREVAAAHSITGRLDVVVASTVPGAQMSSRLENSVCLTARSSTTASTTSWTRPGRPAWSCR